MRRQAHALAVAALLAAVAAPALAQDGRAFTPEDLARLDRVSGPQVSPDGRSVVYQVRATDWDNNRGVTSLWRVPTDGGAPARLAVSDGGAHSPRWAADGKLYFLSARSGSTQLWVSADGGATAVQATDLPLDVGGYALSPDGRRLVVSLSVYPACGDDLACTTGEVEGRANRAETGQIFDRVFVRHWDSWKDGRRNHLYALDLNARGVATGPARGLMRDFDGDTPSVPFGDDSEFTVTPDGEAVIFAAREAGTGEPWSTDFDLYRAPMDGSSRLENLTEDNPAWDTGPVFSPDGRTLAYRAMSRPGFEADRWRILLRDVGTGETREVAADWDRSADALQWSADGRTLFASAGDTGQARIFAIDVASGAVTPMTGDGHVGGFDLAPAGVVYAHDSLAGPADLYLQPFAAGEAPARLTDQNAERMAGVTLGEYEQFSFRGWNDETVYGYVLRPHGFREGERYPVAFIVHGGPQGSFGDAWSYRWNPQTYAGAGYAVVFIDFHGSTGYGQAFTDSITGHWGDRPLEDLQKGWAHALEAYPFLDGERACALGASYGGFMMNWMAGNWNAPWRCLVNHDGIFDTHAMGYATEELWFTEWEHGGTPYDNPEAYERFNPRNHVSEWRVPMLVVQGGRDYRVPETQSLMTFNALQRRGIPSRLLYFPEENHWVLRPKNSVQWHATVQDWLDRWTGGPARAD